MVASGAPTMIDVAQWQLHGRVRSVGSDVAEWDRDRRAWKDRRFFRFAGFDPDGRISRLDGRGVRDSIYRTEYVYGTEGAVIEERSGTAGERPQFVRRWAYDERGREAAISIVGDDGSEDPVQRSTYDEQGRRTDRMTLAPRHGADAQAYGVKGSEFGYGAPAAATQI